MTPDDIVRFASRDWSRLALAKDHAWQAAKRGRSPAEDLRAADELRRYAAIVRPDWPTALDRRDDLRIHLRVSEALGAVRVGSR